MFDDKNINEPVGTLAVPAEFSSARSFLSFLLQGFIREGDKGAFNPPLQDFASPLKVVTQAHQLGLSPPKDFQYSFFCSPLTKCLTEASCSYLIEHEIIIASSVIILVIFTAFNFHLSYSDEIVPSESSFSIKLTCVELRLKKASSVRWKALERPQHSPGITVTNSSQLTNHIQKHSQQPTNQNTDDSMLNDLSVVSNSSPHANSHAPTFEPHNDVTMMSQQRKEPYSSVPQGGSYPSPSPSSTLNQTSAYSSQYPPTTPKLSPSQIPPAAMETTDPSYRYNQLRRPSYTGLCNFANNCFMNSVVQCLSNTRELRDYFIEGRYLADINATNPLGFKGELAKCFGSFGQENTSIIFPR